MSSPAGSAPWRQECLDRSFLAVPESLRPFVESLDHVPTVEEALELFCTPQRTDPARKERMLLERGIPFTIDDAGDQVQGWTWGEGPPVAFAHGWSGRAVQLVGFIEAVEAAGMRAIAVDFPAHGISGGDRTTGLRVASCLQTLDQTFGPLHGLVAYSFGTAGATWALSHGLRVKRAVYIAPLCFVDIRCEQFARAVGITDVDAFWDVVDAKFGPGRLLWVNGDVRAPHVTTPVRIFHDVEDADTLISHGRALAAAWPGAELVETEKLGHARIIRSEPVVSSAVQFLRQNSG